MQCIRTYRGDTRVIHVGDTKYSRPIKCPMMSCHISLSGSVHSRLGGAMGVPVRIRVWIGSRVEVLEVGTGESEGWGTMSDGSCSS